IRVAPIRIPVQAGAMGWGSDMNTQSTHRKGRLAGEEGFSLIELLVVVIIIGVLAAIAIPNFLLEQSKAHDVDAKSSARAAMTALEVYASEHDNYDGVDPAALKAIEPALTKLGPSAFTVSGSGQTYDVDVTSDSAA